MRSIQSLTDRKDREDGFTLIELMVVVLIIAILIAIAIPTFLGARQRAQDRAAQSSIRNGLTAAKTIFTDNENFLVTASAVTELTAVEPSLTFQAAASNGQNIVSVLSVDADTDGVYEQIRMAAKSKSGKCFWIRDVSAQVTGGPAPGTQYASQASCVTADAGAAGLTFGASW